MKEKNAPTIPSIIHFIWLGGPILEEHLASIQKLALIAHPKFHINLWTNDEQTVYKTLNKMSPDALEMPKTKKIAGIQLRNISELPSLMEKDPFFQKNHRLKKIITNIGREMIGFKNFGAASDWLRYSILYLFGGYYFDTDTRFNIKITDQLIADRPFFGFKTNMTNEENNSDIIGILPKHTLMKSMLVQAINQYADLERTIYPNINNVLAETFHLSAAEKPSKMTVKRWDRTAFAWPHEGRMELTVKASGPIAYKTVINEYLQKFKPATRVKHEASIRIGRDSNEEPTCKIANIECIPNTEGSWFQVPKNKVSFFDTNQLDTVKSFNASNKRRNSI